MKIDLTIESNINSGFSANGLEVIANDISNKLDLEKNHTTIEVFLVSNDKIKELNNQYLGKDETTDVLSFPQEQFPSNKEQTLGTIFIAPEFAKTEKIDPKELFVHGVLHLLGFDHETKPTEWKSIESKARKTL